MIVITGGMGFIGMHTTRRFLDQGEPMVVTHYRVRRTPDFIVDELGKRLAVETIDVTSPHDIAEVVRKHQATGIVHLAVPGLVGLTPGEEYRVNMQGLLNVLEAGRMFGVRRVTIASSITVYAGLPRGPFEESATLPMESRNSTEGYKKAWEILALLYGAQAGLDVQVLRLGGIYGPLYHSMANLASRLCHAAVRSRPLDLAGGRGGVPFEDDDNDWCYVKDCAEGIRLAFAAENPLHPIYNIGGGVGASNRELGDAVRAVAPQFEAVLQPGRNPRARQSNFMELSRANAEIGYAPEYDVRRGIADYVSWLRDNPE